MSDFIEIGKQKNYYNGPQVSNSQLSYLFFQYFGLDKGSTLVTESEKRLSHATELKQEANAIVKVAKREVEQILLEKEL